MERQFNPNHLRYGSLRTVTFATDAQGNAIGAVTLLLVAPDVIRGPVRVFCRDDDTGEWSSSVLGTVANSRSQTRRSRPSASLVRLRPQYPAEFRTTDGELRATEIPLANARSSDEAYPAFT